MKILLINGNRTQSVTDHCIAEAQKYASKGTAIAGVTAQYGANIVTAEAENLIASMAVLDMLAANYEGYDAAILAISFDSGLFAARDLVPTPVIGMTEAALMAASRHSNRIAVLIFGAASLPLYRAAIDRYPMREAVLEIKVVEVTSVAAYLDGHALDTAVLAAIEDLRVNAGIETVVISGAAMSGMAERLQKSTTSRLFGGMEPAVTRAEHLLTSGKPGVELRSALARSAILSNLSPALMTLFAKRNKQV
jgi:allantoin racemase